MSTPPCRHHEVHEVCGRLQCARCAVGEVAVVPAAPINAARESLKLLIAHTLHYASMPHASPDAHRDAANARQALQALG